MSFVWGIKDYVTGYFLGKPVTSEVKNLNSKEAFQKNLSDLAQEGMDPSQCIKNCICCVEKVFHFIRCDLSEKCISEIESQLEKFNQSVDEYSSSFNEQQISLMKSEFKQSCLTFIEEKWIRVMAESFYVIPSISDPEERVSTAQKWVDHYFSGLEYLLHKVDPNITLTSNLLFKLHPKLSNALEAYSNEKAVARLKLVHNMAQRQPIAYETIQRKIEMAPNSLTQNERDFEKFSDQMPYILMGYSPEANQQIKLLRETIWAAFAVQGDRKANLWFEQCQKKLSEVFEYV
jgi:hypothetical protein